MKISISLLLFVLPFIGFSQSSELETLQKRQGELSDKIEVLSDSLSAIENRILYLSSQEMLKDIEGNPLISIASEGAELRTAAGKHGEVIKKYDNQIPVKILDKVNVYFMVEVSNNTGFMHEKFVDRHPRVKEFEKAIEQRQNLAVKERVSAKEREEKERMSHPDEMVRKYGKSKVDKMKKGLFWKGMNKEMLIYSIGRPMDINKTVGSWGTHEQWIYRNNLYIYFENEVLTAWQD